MPIPTSPPTRSARKLCPQWHYPLVWSHQSSQQPPLPTMTSPLANPITSDRYYRRNPTRTILVHHLPPHLQPACPTASPQQIHLTHPTTASTSSPEQFSPLEFKYNSTKLSVRIPRNRSTLKNASATSSYPFSKAASSPAATLETSNALPFASANYNNSSRNTRALTSVHSKVSNLIGKASLLSEATGRR